jgi:hypothetical protein
MKNDALARSQWRTRCGKGYGPVTGQTHYEWHPSVVKYHNLLIEQFKC